MIINHRVITWTAGERILKLPIILQPIAILYKNLLKIVGKETEAETEIRIKLSLGVEYIYSCAVQGDIAEFGTMTGRTASIMASAVNRCDRDYSKYNTKRIHLFDSFIGLPDAESKIDKESPQVKSGVWSKGTCKGISKELLVKMCSKYIPKDRITIYDGWFKDTLCQISKETTFALIHIDCDLYQSTIEVLDYLFANQHVDEGSAIFFDDYNCNRASPELGERRAWKEIIEKYSVIFSDGGEYGSACRKFIIHAYREKK